MDRQLIATGPEIAQEFPLVLGMPEFDSFVGYRHLDPHSFSKGALVAEYRGWAVGEIAAHRGGFLHITGRDPGLTAMYYLSRLMTQQNGGMGISAEDKEHLMKFHLVLADCGSDPVHLYEAHELGKSGWLPL
jgi:hypothetical protein